MAAAVRPSAFLELDHENNHVEPLAQAGRHG
jgi:hypothetical protein